MTGRILIVDDLATNRIILKVKLNAACHETLLAATGAEALEIAHAQQPKLILMDMQLPDMSGIDVCRRLRASPATQHIPVVIVTGINDRASRLQALEAGVDEFLAKPLNEVILLARIRSLLRAHQTETELRLRSETWGGMDLAEGETVFALPGRIGLIAAETAISMVWRSALSPYLRERLMVLSPAAALADTPPGAAPDFYMIASDLGRYGSGQRLVSDLRSRTTSRHSAIALVLTQADPETAAMALDVGASDLFTMPMDPQETALRISLHVQRKRRADGLRSAVSTGLKMAITDPLTGLYNRRYALAHLDRIAAESRETGRRFAVMVLDLDRFKAINDTYGHATGDAVLETVARRLSGALDPGTLLARIGGEEFLVVIPTATLADARHTAETLCQAIGGAPISLPDGRGNITVTISVGLAMCSNPPPTPTRSAAREALARADAALMGSKTDGRNQVTINSAA
ncbi:diguanylate cyclase domain-containing protein [Pararhodobacter zhoushanensis]|uniref:diguanylate cyclase domain-containing protein n=1 Tax=Pararhodobacter zhoushanensis TaxID=2479545 RepID=UPI000F8D3925|nr:diguanylate cyclase [Pararhodobacter zhoushanensis]